MKKLIAIMIMGLSMAVWATPTTKILVVDKSETGSRVIEVMPDGTFLEEFKDLKNGETLNQPSEAVPLVNGNILIADSGNGRIIEVRPDKSIARVWENLVNPVDVRKCVWYDGDGNGTDTLLVVEEIGTVSEIGYWDRGVKWSYYNSYGVKEAEKRPGKGTPTYLIVMNNNKVEIGTSTETGDWIPSWTYVGSCQDAEWLPNGNVLIVESNCVKEIKPSFGASAETWIGFGTAFSPQEATMIENGNILVAGYDEINYSKVVEVTPEGTQTDFYVESDGAQFCDVEAKAIINIARIEYKDQSDVQMPIVLAGTATAIAQLYPPCIEATKNVESVDPIGPGDYATYTITYKNSGSSTAKNVIITDQIPTGTEYVATGTTTGPTPIIEFPDGENPVISIRWTISEVKAIVEGGLGGSVSFTIRVKE